MMDAGARALIGPALRLDLSGPIALATKLDGERVRFGAQAETALLLGEDSAYVASVDSVTEDSRDFGYPIATVRLAVQRELPTEARRTLLRWWRISNAVEIGSLASAALALTRDYLLNRQQFGRPIASLQSVQHRLANLHVQAAGTT
jgi:hypothetical protein